MLRDLSFVLLGSLCLFQGAAAIFYFCSFYIVWASFLTFSLASALRFYVYSCFGFRCALGMLVKHLPHLVLGALALLLRSSAAQDQKSSVPADLTAAFDPSEITLVFGLADAASGDEIVDGDTVSKQSKHAYTFPPLRTHLSPALPASPVPLHPSLAQRRRRNPHH